MKFNLAVFLILCFIVFSLVCTPSDPLVLPVPVLPPPSPPSLIDDDSKKQSEPSTSPGIELIILGIAQDAGYPQANCKKSCCTALWDDKSRRKMVSCLGIRDYKSQKTWLFDATPDFKDQLQILNNDAKVPFDLAGIFLTHAHIGHYTGLVHLGREAMGAESVKVYTMPKMKSYLASNGPWSQLVSLDNINLQDLENNKPILLAEGRIKVIPLLVPHRDEFSETVGYRIETQNQSVLFIPDIDKWSKWNHDIKRLISEVDLAFLDGTFYRNGEIWGRDMSQIPHPFIEESLSLLAPLADDEKSKVHFIHLNHTNPLLNVKSEEFSDFTTTQYKVAIEGSTYEL